MLSPQPSILYESLIFPTAVFLTMLLFMKERDPCGWGGIAVIHSYISCWVLKIACRGFEGRGERKENKGHKEAWIELFKNGSEKEVLDNSLAFQDPILNLTNRSEKKKRPDLGLAARTSLSNIPKVKIKNKDLR